MVIQDIYNSIENLKSLEGIDYLIIGYSTFLDQFMFFMLEHMKAIKCLWKAVFMPENI